MNNQNRLWNCRNPYQGSARHVLCLCSAGLLRSSTCANVLHREFGHNTRSVGLDKGHALILVDEVLIEWADEIVVMEAYMAEDLQKDYDLGNKHIINLDIKDSYNYMDEKLQKLILERYKNESERA